MGSISHLSQCPLPGHAPGAEAALAQGDAALGCAGRVLCLSALSLDAPPETLSLCLPLLWPPNHQDLVNEESGKVKRFP